MKDKVVVITGASKGLGKALAYVCAKKGAKVVVSARTRDEIESIAREIGGVAVVADVTKGDDVKKLREEVVSRFGRVDVWINNAGVWLPPLEFEDVDIERIREMYEVNVFGLMYGTQEALKEMKKQESGIIVQIISTSALSARPQAVGYASSKWAVRGFTESLQEEVKDIPIRIIAVHPGGMKTHLFDEQKPQDFDEFLDVDTVAEMIVANMEKDEPDREQVIRRK